MHTTDDRDDLNAEWAQYRKDYGVNEKDLRVAHLAFKAGWAAHRDQPTDGALV